MMLCLMNTIVFGCNVRILYVLPYAQVYSVRDMHVAKAKW